jgi:para-aminobenzoate synthetase component 1
MNRTVSVEIKQRISRKYLESQNAHHIQQEICMKLICCMEFYAENAIIDPLDKFLKLNEILNLHLLFFLKQPPILLSASRSGT